MPLENKNLNENSVAIQIYLDEINAIRNELYSREQNILKIRASSLAVVFVIFGYAFKAGYEFLFLLIPALIASGFCLMLQQDKISYILAAHIHNIEEELNSYLPIKIMSLEKDMHKLSSNKTIQIIDASLFFLIMFPLYIIYLGSLYYISLIYNNAWFFPYVISFYIFCMIIILFLIYYFGERYYYATILEILAN